MNTTNFAPREWPEGHLEVISGYGKDFDYALVDLKKKAEKLHATSIVNI